MILVLGYFVLSNIHQCWVVLGDTIGEAVASRQWQGDWERGKVKLESWHVWEMETNGAVSFYNINGHFNSHSVARLVLCTCIFIEKQEI